MELERPFKVRRCPLVLGDGAIVAEWTGKARRDGAIVHHWGQFTKDLPKKFRPQGEAGHQYLPVASKADAVALVDALASAVRARFPNAKLAGAPARSIAVPKKGAMTIKIEPMSHLTLAHARLEAAKDGNVTTIDVDGRAVALWGAAGEKLARIGRRDRGDVVFFRSWRTSKADLEVAEALCANAVGEKLFGVIDVASGQLAVVSAALEGTSPERLVLDVSPGTYEVFGSTRRRDGWFACWCRLARRR